MAAGKLAVARGMARINWFAIQLGDQDMEDRIKNGFRCAFQQVREADKDASLAKPYGVIDVGKAVKADLKFRHGCARAQLTIHVFKHLGESGGYHLLSKCLDRQLTSFSSRLYLRAWFQCIHAPFPGSILLIPAHPAAQSGNQADTF